MTPKKQAPPSLFEHYEQLVKKGQIRGDSAQRDILSLLEQLSSQLSGTKAGGPLSKIWKRQSTKGLYMWGGVGRGKSMLMDLFFEHIHLTRKRRVHFHAFMQEVHARIHQLRQQGGGDPVMVLAQQIAEETSLLCFDELQATDVADATLLYRLFQGLFDANVVIVSTSNHPPMSLYTGGVQRERFAKFIALIEENMRIAPLSSQLDYRHLQIKNLQTTYFCPLGTEANNFITETLKQLCSNPKPKKETLNIKGRAIHFALYDNSIGRFSFSELCETARGPADYLAIAKRLDTMILTDIPQLPPEKRNEAKRLVTLIDALYEHKVRLLCTAAVPPEQIYNEGDGAFEFKRTVSRLTEMQSAKWIENE